MDPNKFLIRLLDRFGLTKWAQLNYEGILSLEGVSSVLPQGCAIFNSLAEELFHLLYVDKQIKIISLRIIYIIYCDFFN